MYRLNMNVKQNPTKKKRRKKLKNGARINYKIVQRNCNWLTIMAFAVYENMKLAFEIVIAAWMKLFSVRTKVKVHPKVLLLIVK